MKREFLESLGISTEAISQIMAENGRDIENARASEKTKAETQIQTLQAQVTDLQTQIGQRDTDLKDLQTQLTAAQADAGKLTEAQDQLKALQSKYDKDTKAWESKTAQQKREYAIKAAAAELKFTSASAKRAFVSDAIKAASIKLDGDDVLGYKDFLTQYRETDPGAFKSDEPTPAPEPAPKEPEPVKPAPSIVFPAKNMPPKKTMTLSELMKAKNADPNLVIDFRK